MKQMMINELTHWKDKRNKGLHEMVKLQADELHGCDRHYESFKSTIDEGLEISGQLNKFRQRVKSAKLKEAKVKNNLN